MNYGSLFSGVDGLGLAVEAAWDCTPSWYAESDPHASTVHDLRWPSVPNLGDVAAVDWGAVPPVDLLCGGPPCQPFSSAGRRFGVSDDRWMWPAFAHAVCSLRPRWVVLENVAALVADGDAFGWIIGDLAEAGFDARWGCLRASDVGAPHRRERLFLFAHASGSGSGGEGWDQADGTIAVRPAGGAGGPGDGLTADAVRDQPERRERGRGLRGAPGANGRAPREQRLRAGTGDGGAATADAHGSGRQGAGHGQGRRPLVTRSHGAAADATRSSDTIEPEGTDATALVGALAGAGGGTGDRPTPEGVRGLERGAGVAWGPYAPAIARWERIRGIPAPDPVDERGRLNPALSEWMMGLPPGWVTEAPIPRAAMHRCIGNSVVPQCAEFAIRQLTAGDPAVAA